ncbi:MAG: xanthine dehydrogenase family protein molybdopterin-binding subunit [Candidatus Dormiibacterota bacterium]
MVSDSPSYVGAPVRRREDDRLLRGRGRYLDDIELHGALHAAFLRSAHANARIVSIDVAAATAAPGVHLVLTGHDIGALNSPLPLLSPNSALSSPRTQLPLAVSRVRYVGEAVAMIVADDRYLAEDAAALVRVDYEPLGAVVDLVSAAGSADRVHDEVPGNLAGAIDDGIGDVEAAFANAPFVERLHLSLERTCASPIETRGVLAEWDPKAELLRVWDSTQAPVAIKHGLCRLLGLPQDQVEVVAPDVGGGFGAKIMLFYPEEVLVPFAARQLGLPVKWAEDRWEHFVAANQERGQIHDAEIAFDADGTILAVRTSFIHDTGAYIPYGIAVPANTATHVLGQYKVANYSVHGDILYTNKPPVSPYRGAGRPHAVFVMERLICAVGRRLGVEPHVIRARNLIPADEFPYDVGLHIDAPVRYDSGNYPAAFGKALDHLDPTSFRIEQREARNQGRFIGMGMGTYVESTGPGPYEGCAARLTDSGTFVFDVATASQGQGHSTSLAQIAADALGATFDQVVVRGGDSSRVEFGLGTFGSRSLLLAGNAVAQAALELRRQLADYAADLFECSAADLQFLNGGVQVIGSPENRISFAGLAALTNPYGYPVDRVAADDASVMDRLSLRAGQVIGVPPLFQARGFFGAGQQLYGSGVHAATIEVDLSTGDVRLIKYVLVHDCGVMVNPMIVEGQVLGGLVQGIGGALLERLAFDPNGQPLSANFMDFRLPTADVVPEVILDHVETPSPLNPLGVKGTGEAGVIPVSAVIAEAIEDALSPLGVRVDRMPLMPYEILRLVADAGRAANTAEAKSTRDAQTLDTPPA